MALNKTNLSELKPLSRELDPVCYERGVALISVLLIFAIASVLAIRMMSSGSIQVEQAGSYLHRQQLEAYSRGVESYVQALLLQDVKEDNLRGDQASDHRGEAWAKLERFPLDQFAEQGNDAGEILLKLEPVDHLFNVNGLIDKEGKRDNDAYSYFRRLMSQYEVPQGVAEQTLDWLDDDDNRAGLLGAEDNEYLLKEPPYRSPDARIADISELLLINEAPVKAWPEFREVIMAFPGPSKANLNWISPEQLALMLNKSLIDTEQWLKERKDTPISSIEQFLTDRGLDAGLKKRLAVRSEYFRLRVIVTIHEQKSWLTSIIFRDSEKETIRVLSRNYLPFGEKRVLKEKSKETV